jgi:hypothetical protein
MKTKSILLGILSLMTFATSAQTEKHKVIEPKKAKTEFKFESENLSELKNFDWNMLRELFEENDSEEEITLTIAYVNKSAIDKSKLRVDNFELKLTGKTADLDKLTSKLKNSIEKMGDKILEINN